MSPYLTTIGLLTLSNVFMTFAWYAHLKNLADKPWVIAVIYQRGALSLFEYLLQVPDKSYWLYGDECWPAKDLARSHHLNGICAVRGVLPQGKADMGLLLCRFMYTRCSLFYHAQ